MPNLSSRLLVLPSDNFRRLPDPTLIFFQEENAKRFLSRLQSLQKSLEVDLAMLALYDLARKKRTKKDLDNLLKTFGKCLVPKKTEELYELRFDLGRVTVLLQAPSIPPLCMKVSEVYSRLLKMLSGNSKYFLQKKKFVPGELECIKDALLLKSAKMEVVTYWLGLQSFPAATEKVRLVFNYIRACSLIVKIYSAFLERDLSPVKKIVDECGDLTVPLPENRPTLDKTEFSLTPGTLSIPYYLFTPDSQTVTKKAHELLANSVVSRQSSEEQKRSDYGPNAKLVMWRDKFFLEQISQALASVKPRSDPSKRCSVIKIVIACGGITDIWDMIPQENKTGRSIVATTDNQEDQKRQ